MKLSYRGRRRLRRLGIGLLVLLLAGMVIWLCWVIWLERYVVYTKDGAKLDFSASLEDLQGVEAIAPTAGETMAIYYDKATEPTLPDDTLKTLAGYYITTDDLVEDIGAVRQKVAAMEKGTAVMVDVKSIYGNFFYSTGISGAQTSDSVDTGEMDRLIEDLTGGDFYAIARLPAFRDRSYGKDHTNSGLPTEEGYLWEDEDGCYWLNPADSGTVSYLAQIAAELRTLGFDEVVFTDFRFPETDEIVFPDETPKGDILKDTAADMVSACAVGGFTLSFQTGDQTFTIPQGRSRLYLTGVTAQEVDTVAAQVAVADPNVNLVFLADSNDTRYNAYGVLRPLENAAQ